mmetsp:Transcript_17696/g.36723  ORF Transcript_17696/g.36723 Transcript_17696/m.36723 type:complete len:269 (-) Transcript_17696:792-1598(-)|eukprot:CAMPEP_0184690236 /NCGR_PEP_ID=MMETSP0312-20130426/31108_1 /TAXON_ID=31354 /ORGANISM="Compsopogon coeruleus, Strain SAG 36.94" /LENGTH=268 /DNA_ID=CAMNT_0027147695 /DNA_START=435 /DNA_END=1241 /DNA_ORIENTATION=+
MDDFLDGKPMLRDGTSGDWIGTFEGHKGAVWGAAITRDAMLAATGGADFSARVWDAITGDCMKVFLQKHICKSVSFSASGKKLAVSGLMAEVSVFDTEGSSVVPLQSFESGKGGLKFTKYIGSREDILIGAHQSMLKVWDCRTGHEERAMETNGTIISGEMSGEGNLLSIVSGETAQFWDLESLSLMKILPVPASTESVSLHPNHKNFVSGGRDLAVRICDYETGAELECLRGHHGPIWVVRYAPGGDSFSSGSDDGTIRIWPVSESP